MVAIATLLLLQDPPAADSVKEMGTPTQTTELPLIIPVSANAATVTGWLTVVISEFFTTE